MHPADRNPRITKPEKGFAKRLDFKDIKFSVKVRDIHKIERKNNSIGINVSGCENKEKYPIYISKRNALKKTHVDLLLIGEERNKHYVLIQYFNTCMYNHTLHHRRKKYCR